ncbi:2'-deoxycytidine 5'-triphosphate deaminase [Polyangium aurulentum]|uniref:2'-deoxycytidine 5'-triphosphate deaminase n=1 Tax=Polyangium aurulentum TaxID=2567896 RepID=UPI0010AEDABA|nr:2'-deoxycytidine 5'-triphosphate deaminase [Polyangium aurulentum]UQA63017.1 2'-deoxycytidine 5'-triphosphate deaminase [Polyangium aurulentum]
MTKAKTSGVLPIQRLRELAHSGAIVAQRPLEPGQLQPNSLDLRLGAKAYRTRCSFLPVSGPMSKLLSRYKLYEVDLEDGHVFECNQTYLIPLEEDLALPDQVWGLTNPKSSAGRLDMLARVITEEGHVFDTIPQGYRGKLYLDLMTRSFPIRLRRGDSIVQIRLLVGGKDAIVGDDELVELIDRHQMVLDERGIPIAAKNLRIDDGVLLGVRLADEENATTIAYSSKKATPIVDFSRRDHPVRPFWNYIHASGDPIILEPEAFYIFSSSERVRIPPELCAEMVAFDVKSGEVRTHYAGFFDSGFGVEGSGSHVVLEVRNRDMPFLVQNGQKLFRLRYFWNTEEPEVLYGSPLASHYQGQVLRLAKQFKSTRDEPRTQLGLWED